MERRLWGGGIEASPNLFESGNQLCSQCEGFQDVAGFKKIKKDVSAFWGKTKESIGPVKELHITKEITEKLTITGYNGKDDCQECQ